MLLQDLYIIVKVAEFRSITAAATHLDMRTATASAAVKRVEKSLGAELFIRTTRQLKLSAAGERYLPQCQQAIIMLDQAKQNMKADMAVIDGDLRIAMPSDLGRNSARLWLDEFMTQYPDLNLRCSISDSNIDFYRDAVDMALRYGSPNDASLYGFKIANVPRVLCATPQYLTDYGTPHHPDELLNHNGLLYQLYDVLYNEWQFTQGEQKFLIKMPADRASNDGDLVRRWCLASKGIALKSSLDMADDILSGKVMTLMNDYPATPTELWLVCPSKQSITPAMRLLRDLLRAKTHEQLTALAQAGAIAKQNITD
ncbi:LysR family transcriptional regulator [Shewanella waksmanii]|uniref:LysR family transcriptional regulator n=1 Tax=Shewanella waksmanii TaxID=213783 RepID=UPI000490B0AF|nr:LysR family transcriptional regulator [Shewanella waksmanii]